MLLKMIKASKDIGCADYDFQLANLALQAIEQAKLSGVDISGVSFTFDTTTTPITVTDNTTLTDQKLLGFISNYVLMNFKPTEAEYKRMAQKYDSDMKEFRSSEYGGLL